MKTVDTLNPRPVVLRFVERILGFLNRKPVDKLATINSFALGIGSLLSFPFGYYWSASSRNQIYGKNGPPI